MVERSARDGSRNRTAGARLIQIIDSVYNRCTTVEIFLKTTNEKSHASGSIERKNYRTSDRERERNESKRNEFESNADISKRIMNFTTTTAQFIRPFPFVGQRIIAAALAVGLITERWRRR